MRPVRQHFFFFLFVIASLLAFLVPIEQLIQFAFSQDYGSHILLIAPVSILLVFLRRHEIFSTSQTNSERKASVAAGSSLLFLGLILLLLRNYSALQTVKFSLEILSLVVLWISGFVFCFGTSVFSRARFPLLFLLLLVPCPEVVIEKVIFALQAGSSDVAYGLLKILNVPVLKEGFTLRLPRLDLEVAKECSGIRSSIALLVTVLVAGEFVLGSFWRKLLLVVSIVPILVLKNGLRIVAIYLLTAYVNPAFLHGWLHTSGGIVFYLLGLIVLIPVVSWLRRGESNNFKISEIPELAR